MKFVINQDAFSDILSQHVPVLPTRTTIPILNSLKWDLKNGKLRMHSTDLEISLITQVDVESEDEGSIAVPAKKLSEIVRELRNEPITVETDENNRVVLKGGTGEYKVAGSSSDDFPSVPDEGLDFKVEINGDKFKRMINRTSFAVSHDDMRPTLCGIFLQILPEDIRCVATDGHRLSKFVDKSLSGSKDKFEAIVPVKALNLAIKNIADSDQVKLSAGQKYIMIESNDNFLYSRLIEGKYPLYENVIPKGNQNFLTASAENLTSSLKRVSIFSNSLTKQVKLDISADNLHISAEDVETGGEAEEEIKVDYSGDEMSIGFNANYLLDALRQVDCEEAKFSFGNSDSAGIIEPIEKSENEEFLMLLMPVRLP